MGGHHHHHLHHHGHHHDHGSDVNDVNATMRNLKIALVLNLVFTGIEIAGGLWTGSIAILADALHDFGDGLSLGFAVILEKMSHRQATSRYSYGFRRLSLLSAAITSVVLAVGTVYLSFEAIARFQNPGTPHAPGMMVLAVVGIVANGLPAWKLWNGRTLNERAISWHLLEDVLGWVLVLVGGAAIWIWGWTLIDPLLSVLFAGFIVFGVVRNLRQVVRLFLQAVPDQFNVSKICEQLRTIDGVSDVHDVHVWSLDGERHVMSMHAVVTGNPDVRAVAKIKHEIREAVASHGKVHLTLEIEHVDEHCPDIHCVSAET